MLPAIIAIVGNASLCSARTFSMPTTAGSLSASTSASIAACRSCDPSIWMPATMVQQNGGLPGYGDCNFLNGPSQGSQCQPLARNSFPISMPNPNGSFSATVNIMKFEDGNFFVTAISRTVCSGLRWRYASNCSIFVCCRWMVSESIEKIRIVRYVSNPSDANKSNQPICCVRFLNPSPSSPTPSITPQVATTNAHKRYGRTASRYSVEYESKKGSIVEWILPMFLFGQLGAIGAAFVHALFNWPKN